MNKSMAKCPKCSSLAKKLLSSHSTLIYYVTRYDENGNMIPKPNQTTNYYKCAECGEEYISNE